MKSKLLSKKSLIVIILIAAALVGLSFAANSTIVASRIAKMEYQAEYKAQLTSDGMFLVSFAPDEEGNKYGSIARFAGGEYYLSVADTPCEYNGIKILKIADQAYADSKALQKVILPQTIESIGDSAFIGCEKLEEVYIPASVKQISDNIFENLEGLTLYVEKGSYAESYAKKNNINIKIYTPEQLKPTEDTGKQNAIFDAQYENLQYNILYYNNSPFCAISSFNSQLNESKELIIPQQIDGVDVTVLMDESIYTSGNLETVTLPNTVTAIGMEVFRDCPNLKKVYCSDNVVNIGEFAFADSPQVTICAPKNSYAYKYAIDNGIKYEEYTK